MEYPGIKIECLAFCMFYISKYRIYTTKEDTHLNKRRIRLCHISENANIL